MNAFPLLNWTKKVFHSVEPNAGAVYEAFHPRKVVPTLNTFTLMHTNTLTQSCSSHSYTLARRKKRVMRLKLQEKQHKSINASNLGDPRFYTPSFGAAASRPSIPAGGGFFLLILFFFVCPSPRSRLHGLTCTGIDSGIYGPRI